MPNRGSVQAFPVRQVSRLATELHLSGVANLRILSPDRYERGILLIGLARHGMPDWFAGNSLRRPKELTCYSSISNLAASFGRPFETIRRHIRALVEEGVYVVTPAGVAIGTEAAVAKRLLAYLRLTHDTLLGLAEDMAGLGILPRCPAPSRRPMTRAIMSAALDVQLMPFEGLREPLPDWTRMMVWGVVGALCVRRVTLDAGLSQRFARASTPDHLRDPVTLRTIAAVSALPYQSVWRHIKTMEASGAVRAKGDGYIVSTDYLRAPAMEERVLGAVSYYHRKVAELVNEGLDPSQPVPWLRGRPPWVEA